MQLEGTETECCIISETFDVFVLRFMLKDHYIHLSL